MGHWKRFFCFLLIFSLLLGTSAGAVGRMEDGTLTDDDYAAADAIFARLEVLNTRGRGLSPNGVYAALSRMDGVNDLTWQGSDRMVWTTDAGISCVWSTYYEEIAEHCTLPTEEPEEEVQPQAITHGKDVYLIEPYYGIDNSFTGQYQREAMTIANAMGGHYFLRTTKNATIDKVAQAVENGGLVIFDSHGNTDYKQGADATSGATTSYLCLSTKEGITAADYEGHHVNYTTQGGIVFCEVDGVAISNHMTKNAQNNMIWAAICLGMATDGLCGPLRDRGVNTMYGYSQSVSFSGDYLYEAVFFASLMAGKDVAASITDMKNAYGYWDYSPKMGIGGSYPTIEAARAARCAFPVVSSPQDPYPENADDLQEVASKWRLLEQPCLHGRTEVRDAAAPTCFAEGYTGDTWCLTCGEKIAEGTALAPDSKNCPLACFADVNTGSWYHEAVEYAVLHGLMQGKSGSSFAPKDAMNRAELATVLYNLAGKPEAAGEVTFSDVSRTSWAYDAVTWAAGAGIVMGDGKGCFMPKTAVDRESLAVMLFRYAGAQPGDTASLEGFKDAGRVHTWAVDAVAWAVEAGIIKGYTNGTLQPRNSVTRAEAAQMLMCFDRLGIS